MHRRPFLALAAWASTAAVLGAVLAAAPAAAGESPPKPDGTLVVAHLGPETGEVAPIIESLRAPVRMAVDEINAAGGVNGKPVTLLTADEGDAATTAQQSVDTLLTNGADAIIGPASSNSTLEILDRTKGRALVCSGSNSSETLTTDGPKRSGGLYFRTSPSDVLQGPALAQQVLADGHRKVAVIARDDGYGDSFSRRLTKALRAGGAKVPVVAHYAIDDADAAKQAKKVAAGKPEAIVVIGVLDDAAPVVRALIDAGVNPKELPIYGTDGLYSSRFAELVNPQNPGVVEGIKGTAPASAPAGVTSPFQATFGLTGIDPVFSAHYYDCTILTALAAEKAKSDSPAKMAKAFAANLKGSNGCSTFAECRDLLAAGKTIHWRGASSSFDRFGKFEPDEGVYELWSYDADGTPQAGDPAAQLRVTRPRAREART
jgi:branched-chain amino acid transport system substrate-binding protein